MVAMRLSTHVTYNARLRAESVQPTDSHGILVSGVELNGTLRGAPALLQMNMEDFPHRFLDDLARVPAGGAQLSSTRTLGTPSATQSALKLFQPVQRISHVVMLQLACDTLQSPRLDPRRIDSAGIVIRRVQRSGNGYSAWCKRPDGTFRWVPLSTADLLLDPDPTRRPVPNSGQPAVNALLAAQQLATSSAEVTTPLFPAPPATGDALARTLYYGTVPTASSDVSDAPAGTPTFSSDSIGSTLPRLLRANGGNGSIPAAGAIVDFHWLSDDYAASQPNSTNFSDFSTALLVLYRDLAAFDGSPASNAILAILQRASVTFSNSDGSTTQQDLASFFASAKTALIDYDPFGGAAAPTLTMPVAWQFLSSADAAALAAATTTLLQQRAAAVRPPTGRFQDSDRLYVVQAFFRVKGHTAGCPIQTVWSQPSPRFHIAPWYDGPPRPAAPIPLPDPTSRSFLKAATPNVAFQVPAGLMNAMQGTTLKSLGNGQGGGGGLSLNWICGFNIPLITICAFFVLNIFLALLNIVFFWLPFIKICIPFPVSAPASGDDQ